MQILKLRRDIHSQQINPTRILIAEKGIIPDLFIRQKQH